jgi:hypothetical protein
MTMPLVSHRCTPNPPCASSHRTQPKFLSFSWGPKNTLNRDTLSSSPAPQPPLSDDSPEPPAKRTKVVDDVNDEPDAPKSEAEAQKPDVEEVPDAPKPEIKRLRLDVESLSQVPRPETKRLKLDVASLPDVSRSEARRSHYPASISSVRSRYGSYRASSVRSSGSRAIQSNVSEFRDTERRAMSGMKGSARRQRRPKGFTPAKNSAGDPHLVEDSDDGDDDEVDTIRPGTPIPRRRTGMSLEEIREIEELEQSAGTRRSFRSPLDVVSRSPFPLTVLKRKTQSEMMGDAKRPRVSSPDELTGPGDSPDYQSLKKATRTSTSESLRGAIKPTLKVKKGASSQQSTLEKELEKAKRTIGTGLRIRRAVCGTYGFPGPDASSDLELFLGVHDVSAILLPTDEEGEVAHSYAYLGVELKRVSKIRTSDSEDSSIVAVHRSHNIAMSAGPLLFLEFTKPAEREAFVKWAKECAPSGYTKVHMVSDAAAKLQSALSHSLEQVQRSKVLRDVDAEQPADIQLMQRNRQRQVQSTPNNTAKVPKDARPGSRGKLKDGMRTSRAASQDHSERPGSSGSRATRGKVPQVPEEEVVPSEERWSEQNPGWADDWQQALVFPPNKAVRDRAVVEMPDIPRLDEGEYLNDNLVWFGLRYLKDKLEKTNPELAQRFHFFNTFFYGNLKPAKSGASINYNTVKEWTSKVDLFTKDFIVVPICEYSHWYLAIIYNAPKLVPPESQPSEDKDVQNHPRGSPELGESDIKDNDRVASLRQEAETADSTAVDTSLVETGVRRLSISDNDMGHTDSPSSKTARAMGKGKRSVDAEKSEVIDLSEATPDGKEARPTSRRGQGKKPSLWPRKRDPNQPKIITLDSLGLAHSPTCQILRQYLVAELKDKKGIEIPDPGSLGMTAKGIPRQENYCDCGLYVIGYVNELIKDPDTFVRQLLQNELSEWDFDASALREFLRGKIFGLQQQQQEKDMLEREAKQQRKRQAALAKKTQSQSPSLGEGPKTESESSKAASPAADPVTASEEQGKQDHKDKETKNAAPPPSTATLEAGSNAEDVQVVEPDKDVAETVKNEGMAKPENANNELPKARHSQPVLEPTLPGSYPSSPTKMARRVEHSGSDATEKGFLLRLKSSPTSRGETPDNPVELDDSLDLTEDMVANLDSERQKIPKGAKTKESRSKIEVQIPSRKVHREMESWRTAKASSKKSAYFDEAAAPARGERGSVTAKLVDTSKSVDMVDLSD